MQGTGQTLGRCQGALYQPDDTDLEDHGKDESEYFAWHDYFKKRSNSRRLVKVCTFKMTCTLISELDFMLRSSVIRFDDDAFASQKHMPGYGPDANFIL